MLRESMRRSLEEHGLDVVGVAGDGQEAVRMAQTLRPDVVLMDVSMPVLDGVEATRQLHLLLPSAQVVMLTMHADGDVMARAIQAGAVGYLVKDCSIDDVVAAVRLAGHSSPISPREEEVLQLVADGMSLPEVAAALFISVKTVKNHLASIYSKLDARDRTQAVLRGVRMGIIRLG